MKNLVAAKVMHLDRCPHCRIARPNLESVSAFNALTGDTRTGYKWKVFLCASCGRPVIGGCRNEEDVITHIYPSAEALDQAIPRKALALLQQAIESIHAPAGSVMLCASSVDAMLKECGLKEGSLYSRIQQAVQRNLITPGMAEWAHAVRLDANDQRHADDSAELPTEADAQRSIDFTTALGEFLFVLPSRIKRGLEKHKSETAASETNGSSQTTPSSPPAPRPVSRG